VAILFATLTPSSGPVVSYTCLFCSERGLADGLANILLFFPLGVMLGSLRQRRVLIWLFPFLLSFAIEFSQQFIPGRDPSVADVISNTIGGIAGIAAARTAGTWLYANEGVATLLATAAAVGFAIIVGITGLLLQPDFPPTIYWGLWMPELGQLEWYRGRLDDARLGSLELKSGPMPHQADIHLALRQGTPVMLTGAGGPPVRRLGAIFAIYDQNKDEILLIGPRGSDLVVRYRMHASAVGLDQPELVLPGAMQAIPPAQNFEISYLREADGVCVSVRGSGPGATSVCGLAFSPGRGWSFISYPVTMPGWLKRSLDAVWLAILAVPIGLWTTRARALVVPVLVLGFSLLVLPSWVGLHRASILELMSTGGGLWCGNIMGRLLRAWRWSDLKAAAVPALNRDS
jgi:hypothetical protein